MSVVICKKVSGVKGKVNNVVVRSAIGDYVTKDGNDEDGLFVLSSQKDHD